MSCHLHKPKKDIFKTLYSSCQISSASVRIKSCEQSYKQQEFSGSLNRQSLGLHRQIREGTQLNDFVCFSKVICCILLLEWTANISFGEDFFTYRHSSIQAGSKAFVFRAINCEFLFTMVNTIMFTMIAKGSRTKLLPYTNFYVEVLTQYQIKLLHVEVLTNVRIKLLHIEVLTIFPDKTSTLTKLIKNPPYPPL